MSDHLERIQKVFREVFERPDMLIDASFSVHDEDGWDSVATVNLVVGIEEEFDTRFSTEDVAKLSSVGDFLRLTQVAGLPDDKYVAESDRKPASLRIKLAVVGTSTTHFLAAELKKVARRYGLDLEVFETPFGCLNQEIMKPDSSLYAFGPDFVILHTNWRDLGLSPVSDDADQVFDACCRRWETLWATLRKNSHATLLQLAFDRPEHSSSGALGWLLPAGRERLIARINLHLSNVMPSGLFFLPSPQACSQPWEDSRSWFNERQHPHYKSLHSLAQCYLGAIRAALGQSKKVLVLDLDNTLWGGLVGESGPEGIILGPPSARGEAYLAFQEYLLELRARGVILAVCSKNEDPVARSAFQKHDAMQLRLDDFGAFKANWKPKSENILEIANELNLGLNSFVFVDDNPAECAELAQAFPDIETICLEGDPANLIEKIESGRWFEALSLSNEDRWRNRTYASESKRIQLADKAESYEQYLKSLRMEIRSVPIGKMTLERAVQLINKTNQFNLTTRRHSLSELNSLIESPEYYHRIFGLSDRFGDSGWIGLAIVKQGTDWEIDTFVLSCRVFGRGLEQFMINTLALDARKSGADHLFVDFVPTQKNKISGDFIAGIAEYQQSAGSSKRYVLGLNDFEQLSTALSL